MTVENNQENFEQNANEGLDEKSNFATEQSEKTEMDLLKEELVSSKLEASENYDKFVRLSAEFENFRRRMEREKSEAIKYGSERLFRDLLPVLDSFEKALISKEAVDVESAQNFVKGIDLVWKQMSEVAEKHGLKAIESKDAPFDPNFHQAIQKIEVEDISEEIVGEEYARGYLFHDRLLRPSMVSVKVPK